MGGAVVSEVHGSSVFSRWDFGRSSGDTVDFGENRREFLVAEYA
jgi:hypothetical protein